MLGLSLALVLISYVLQILSSMGDKVEFLKYFSVFTLADTRGVIINVSISPIMVIVSFIISIIFFILTLKKYNRKEFI